MLMLYEIFTILILLAAGWTGILALNSLSKTAKEFSLFRIYKKGIPFYNNPDLRRFLVYFVLLFSTAGSFLAAFLRFTWLNDVGGTMVGYGVQYVPSWEQFSTLATVAATITGPATIAALQRKSLIDVGKDLQEVAERMTNKGRSSSYGSSYPKNVPSDDARRTLPSGGDPYG